MDLHVLPIRHRARQGPCSSCMEYAVVADLKIRRSAPIQWCATGTCAIGCFQCDSTKGMPSRYRSLAHIHHGAPPRLAVLVLQCVNGWAEMGTDAQWSSGTWVRAVPVAPPVGGVCVLVRADETGGGCGLVKFPWSWIWIRAGAGGGGWM